MSKKKKGAKKGKETEAVVDTGAVEEIAAPTPVGEETSPIEEGLTEAPAAPEQTVEEAPAEPLESPETPDEPAVSEEDISQEVSDSEEPATETVEPVEESEGETVTEDSAVEEQPAMEETTLPSEEASEAGDTEQTTVEEGAEVQEELEEIVSGIPLRQIVEAILFASQKPVSTKELVTILKGAAEAEAEKENPNPLVTPFAKIKPDNIRDAVDELRIDCENPRSTYEVRENAAGWQLVTKINFSPWLRQLFPENRTARISAPAMETLAIIAYRQPITRADLEAVRGVAVDGVMQTLLDRSLIKIAGRADIPGRPLLYETTQHFMEHFGLTNLDDLPNATELRKINLPKAPLPEAPAAETPAASTPAPETPVAETSAPASEEAAAQEAPAAVADETVAKTTLEEASPEEGIVSEEIIAEQTAAGSEEVAAEPEIPVENPPSPEEAPSDSDPHHS